MNDKRIFLQIVDYFRPYGRRGLHSPLFVGPLLFVFCVLLSDGVAGNCLGTWNREQGKRDASLFPKATIDRDPIKASFQTEADVMTQQMGARQSNCYMTN